MEHALRRVNIGGKHFDQYFNHLLRKAGITLHTNYWLETVRNIKETMCRLVPDKAFEKLGDDGEMNCESYTMPDGSVMKIGNALKRGPEVLFRINIYRKSYIIKIYLCKLHCGFSLIYLHSDSFSVPKALCFFSLLFNSLFPIPFLQSDSLCFSLVFCLRI